MKNKNRKNKIDFWMFKAPIELKSSLDEIRLARVKNDKDDNFKSYKRLGLAISRHPGLLKDLRNADMPEEDLIWRQ